MPRTRRYPARRPRNTTNRRSAIDGRTTRYVGHVTSLRTRKRIEEPFDWMKTVAGGRKLRYVGLQRNRAWFLMAGAVYNLIRITAWTRRPPDPGGRPDRRLAHRRRLLAISLAPARVPMFSCRLSLQR